MFAKITFILIGLLLAFTASAKLWMLLTDPFADLKTGMPVAFIWLGVFMEFGILAGMCSSRLPIEVKWGCLFVCFGVFLTASVVNWLVFDRNSCGCFGAVEIPPSASALISFCIECSLIVAATRERIAVWQVVPGFRRIEKPQWAVAGGFAVAAILVSLSQSKTAGDFLASAFYRRAVPDLQIDFGAAPCGTPILIQARLINSSDFPIRIVGGGKSCGCITQSGIGRFIPLRGELDLNLEVVGISEGYFRQRVVYYLESRMQSRVTVEIRGVFNKAGQS